MIFPSNVSEIPPRDHRKHEREDNNNLEQLVAFRFYQIHEPAPCRQAFLPYAAGHQTQEFNLTPQNPNLAYQIIIYY
jgi:hypothetical protein